jgi:hypothetical protein
VRGGKIHSFPYLPLLDIRFVVAADESLLPSLLPFPAIEDTQAKLVKKNDAVAFLHIIF